MNYEIVDSGNSVVTCRFEEAINIDPVLYGCLSRNTAILIPGMRDLSDSCVINYDVLGSTPLPEGTSEKVFSNDELYDFIHGIVDVIEKIGELGISQKQMILENENIYMNAFDSSVRFICLPVSEDQLEGKRSFGELLRSICINIRTEGAFALVGFVMEKTSSPDFELGKFKAELEAKFGGNKSSAREAFDSYLSLDGGNVSKAVQRPAAPQHDSAAYSEAAITESYVGREYVPVGVPAVSEPEKKSGNTENNEQGENGEVKTKLLFGGESESKSIPYLSPVDNNSESARIYIGGSVLKVGRGSQNDLRINVATVSSKHAEIRRSADGCVVVDLKSMNKTFVNGKPIEPDTPVKLKHQDLVAFNKARYRFFEQ